MMRPCRFRANGVTMGDFTPYSGFVGGVLIGVAAVLLLLANGRLAGISGIVGGLLAPPFSDAAWRLSFVVGLWLGAVAFMAARGGPIVVAVQASMPVMAVAGLLVGVGTRMGGGCTSGHGICGIARLSKRSFVATAVFIAAAMVTVFVVRHLA
jgi:uncharacterized membrane protein YedE/YeeE